MVEKEMHIAAETLLVLLMTGVEYIGEKYAQRLRISGNAPDTRVER